jgi:hypothetical protein
MDKFDKFDEYKFFAESTQYLSERRQSAAQTYLAVNTAVFALLAFLVKDTGLRDWVLVWASLPLLFVGTIACTVWEQIIRRYKRLIGWRYEQLRAIENDLPDSQQMYQKEWKKFFAPSNGKERFGFSSLEAWLPRLFIGIYIVYGAALLIVTAFGWWPPAGP